VIAAVLAGALVAGCSSHHAHRSAPAASAASAAGEHYLLLATQANARIDSAKSKLRTDATDLASTEDDLRAIASAKRTFDQRLGELTVPDGVKDAVARLVAADTVLEHRLDDGASVTSTTKLAQASAGIIAAGAAAVAAADEVRRGLGLPPISSG